MLLHDHHHSRESGDHGDDTMVRGKKLIIVIFFNMVITIAEYIGGAISGSLALISDAGHNLSDVLALARLARTAERVFGSPQDIEWALSDDDALSPDLPDIVADDLAAGVPVMRLLASLAA